MLCIKRPEKDFISTEQKTKGAKWDAVRSLRGDLECGKEDPLSSGHRIGRLETNGGGLDTTFGRPLSDVVVDGAQNIRVDVVTHRGVNQNLITVTKGIKRVEQASLVQEAHFRSQLDAVQRNAFIFFDMDSNPTLNISA